MRFHGGLEAIVSSFSSIKDKAGSAVRSGMEGILDFAVSHHRAAGIAWSAAVTPAAYFAPAALFYTSGLPPETLYKESPPMVAALVALAAGTGYFVSCYLRAAKQLRELEVDWSSSSLDSRISLWSDVRKPFNSRIVNWLLERPYILAFCGPAYHVATGPSLDSTVAAFGRDPLQMSLGMAASYAVMYFFFRVEGPSIRQKLFAPYLRGGYAYARSVITRNPSVYSDELEKIALDYPLFDNKLIAAEHFRKRGMTGRYLEHLRSVSRNPVITGKPLFSPLNSVSKYAARSYEAIMSGRNGQIPYIALASVLLGTGHHAKADELIERMVRNHDSLDSRILAFWFFRDFGEVEQRTRYIAESVDLILQDPDKHRREHLGEDPSNVVFQVSHPLLGREIFFKFGTNLYSVAYEKRMDDRRAEILSGLKRFAAVEPLYAAEVLGHPVYARTQIPGITLMEHLASGNATVDDVLLAWELTERLHKGTKPGMSRVFYRNTSEKLGASFSKPYLAPYQPELGRLRALAEPIDDLLSGAVDVLTTDGHPDNRIWSNGVIGAIDAEDRGNAKREEEIANLLRYRAFPLLADNEESIVRDAGCDPHAYLGAVLKRDASFIAARLDLSRPGRRAFVRGKIAEVNEFIDRIRFACPSHYSRFSSNYSAARDGLSRLDERIAE